jgi:Cu(I)/Ag(I) efflux system membrane fusion protein/cobalt-zinc-cadmium efflux system membrane fusion protein
MKNTSHPTLPLTLAALVLAGLGIGAGYWWGTHNPAASANTSASAEKKILYYRNPMGLPDTSPVPKKDPMGMDYIAVREGEQDEPSDAGTQLKISAEKIQKLGVKTELAGLRTLDKVIRVAGRIEPDERRTFTIAPKFEGYVENLQVNTTGQTVSKGQVLFDAYSPELVAAQREYAISMQGMQALASAGTEAQGSVRQMADASLARLRNWDVSTEQLKELAQTGTTRRTLGFRSPVAGVITEKKAVQGMRFMPGDMLFQVADLSTVWVIADVFEQDIGAISKGMKSIIKLDAYPGKEFSGTITYIYPTLNAETRTVPVRIELANAAMLFKPGMFARVEMQAKAPHKVTTIPVSAVIDSGTRQLVLVQVSDGRFEPREVSIGARSDTYLEVTNGVREGEKVVVSANFLIDAESNLQAAISGMSTPLPGASAPRKAVGHQTSGTIEEIDAKANTLTIRHEPVASLKWPAMTMDFNVANTALLQGLKTGSKVNFEFVERGKGEWVITAVQAK